MAETRTLDHSNNDTSSASSLPRRKVDSRRIKNTRGGFNITTTPSTPIDTRFSKAGLAADAAMVAIYSRHHDGHRHRDDVDAGYGDRVAAGDRLFDEDRVFDGGWSAVTTSDDARFPTSSSHRRMRLHPPVNPEFHSRREEDWSLDSESSLYSKAPLFSKSSLLYPARRLSHHLSWRGSDSRSLVDFGVYKNRETENMFRIPRIRKSPSAKTEIRFSLSGTRSSSSRSRSSSRSSSVDSIELLGRRCGCIRTSRARRAANIFPFFHGTRWNAGAFTMTWLVLLLTCQCAVFWTTVGADVADTVVEGRHPASRDISFEPLGWSDRAEKRSAGDAPWSSSFINSQSYRSSQGSRSAADGGSAGFERDAQRASLVKEEAPDSAPSMVDPQFRLHGALHYQHRQVDASTTLLPLDGKMPSQRVSPVVAPSRQSPRATNEAASSVSSQPVLSDLAVSPSITIGCLVPVDLTPDSVHMLAAVTLAVGEINLSKSLLPNHTLLLAPLNYTTQPVAGQMAALQLASMDPMPVAVVGPRNSDQAALVSPLAAFAQIPFVSPSATDVRLTAGGDRPYFMRTIHNDGMDMRAIAEFLAFNKWSEVIVIHSDNRFGRNGIASLNGYLSVQEQWKVRIATRVPIKTTWSVADTAAALAAVERLDPAVFVVHAAAALCAVIFSAANQMQLVGKNSVWVASEGAALVNSTVLQNVEGMVITSTYLPPSPRLTSFRENWANLNPIRFPNASKEEPKSYTLAAYDATYLIAWGLHSLLYVNHSTATTGSTSSSSSSSSSSRSSSGSLTQCNADPSSPSYSHINRPHPPLSPPSHSPHSPIRHPHPPVSPPSHPLPPHAPPPPISSPLWPGTTRAAAAAQGSDASGCNSGTALTSSPTLQTDYRNAVSRKHAPQLRGLKRSLVGPMLRQAMLSATFDGVRGRITLNSHGDLQSNVTRILNVINGTAMPVGFWTSSLLLTPSLDLPPMNGTSRILNITFPGNTTKPPSGAFPRRKLLLAVPYKKGFQQFVNITSSSASPPTNETASYSFSGFTVELFRLAVSKLPYKADYELVPFVGDDGGGADAAVGYDDMLQAVADEKFDGAIGDISVTQARSKLVDFTQPFMASAVSVIAYVPPSSSWWMALAPFTPSMWAAFLGMTFATGLITVFLECRQNWEFQGKLHELLQHALWFGYLSIFSFLEKPVRTLIARIVLALWLLVTFVVVTSFTANMTSIITVNMLTVPSLDVNSVINANNPIAYQAGSFIEGYLTQLGVQKHNMVPLNSAEEYNSALVTGRVKVVVDEDPYLDLLRANHCSMAQVRQPYSFLSMSFAFQKGSQLRRDISAAILHLTMTGELDQLQQDYLLGGTRLCPDTLMPEAPAVLANENFWGLFVGYAVVSLACCLLYVGLLVFRGAMVARELSRQQAKSYNTDMVEFVPANQPANQPADQPENQPAHVALAPAASFKLDSLDLIEELGDEEEDEDEDEIEDDDGDNLYSAHLKGDHADDGNGGGGGKGVKLVMPATPKGRARAEGVEAGVDGAAATAAIAMGSAAATALSPVSPLTRGASAIAAASPISPESAAEEAEATPASPIAHATTVPSAAAAEQGAAQGQASRSDVKEAAGFEKSKKAQRQSSRPGMKVAASFVAVASLHKRVGNLVDRFQKGQEWSKERHTRASAPAITASASGITASASATSLSDMASEDQPAADGIAIGGSSFGSTTPHALPHVPIGRRAGKKLREARLTGSMTAGTPRAGDRPGARPVVRSGSVPDLGPQAGPGAAPAASSSNKLVSVLRSSKQVQKQGQVIKVMPSRQLPAPGQFSGRNFVDIDADDDDDDDNVDFGIYEDGDSGDDSSLPQLK